MTVSPAPPLGERITPGTADQHVLDYVSNKHFTRVFLVTGHRSFSWFEDRGFIDKLTSIAEVTRWSEARPNPEFLNLKEGLEEVAIANPDIIVGVGGGSVLDMAKLLAVLHHRDLAEVDAVTSGTLDLSTREVHLALVPTTAGSGAEATHFSVLYRDTVKFSIAGSGLLPDHIVLDPSVVTSGDRMQLAASGLDALCQCVESIWARGATEQSRKHAVEGLQLVAQSLIAFVQGDESLAGDLQWGSHLGGHAINTSKTTASHALSYFLTMRFGVPHGIAVASTLGYFIEHHHKSLEAGNSSNKEVGSDLKTIRSTLGLTGKDSAIDFFQSLFDKLELGRSRSYWPKNSGEINEWVVQMI
jgi:alcohol dehydrogenase